VSAAAPAGRTSAFNPDGLARPRGGRATTADGA
jgi:hypothetical protein